MQFDDRTIPDIPIKGAGQPEDVPAKLVVLRGDIKGRIVDLGALELRIGRHEDNDLVLPSGRISRHHARISRRGDAFFVEDLKSSNGTSHNARRISPDQPERMRHQDTVELSEYQLLYLERGGSLGELDLQTIELDQAKVRAEAEEALRDFLGE